MIGSRVASKRTSQPDIEEAEYDGPEVPNDTLVALELLRKQFPQTPAAGTFPVVLVSQIYSLVKDRTAVDRDLDKAVRRQQLRLFRWVKVACISCAELLQSALYRA
jgi:hypothetical protein